MKPDYKFLVLIGSDSQIQLHRCCRRNWENYFDLLGFHDYYFYSRSFDLCCDDVVGHDLVVSWPVDLREGLLRKFEEVGPHYADWSGIFGQAMLKASATAFRLLLNRYPDDFVLHCPTSTSAIDIEAVQTFVSLNYLGGHFYGGSPVPVLNQSNSQLFWYISGSGLTMSRSTIETLLSRSENVPTFADDFLYGLLLHDLPRSVFQRRSIAIEKNIVVEFEATFNKINSFRQEGIFSFRFNSSFSPGLEGGRDSNDSLTQNLGMNILFKSRGLPVQYVSQEFLSLCERFSSKFESNLLQPGSFQASDTNVIVSGF